MMRIYRPDQQVPSEIERHLDAADGYLTLGLREEATQELVQAEQLCKGLDTVIPQVLISMSHALLHFGDMAKAAQVLEEAVDRFPNYGELVAQRAFALRCLGLDGDAHSVLMKSNLVHTGLLHYNLACYEALLGDVDLARVHIKQACALNVAMKKMARRDPDLWKLWAE